MKKVIAIFFILYFSFLIVFCSDISVQMVQVQKGSFWMGNTREDPVYPANSGTNGIPVHKVEITYNYEIGKYEITNAQFLKFLNNSDIPKEGYLNDHELIHMNEYYCPFTYANGKFYLKTIPKKRYPVLEITWWGAIEYCNWLSEYLGYPKAYDEMGNLLDKKGLITKDISKVSGYRLPTEAEWEYAARGGHKDIFFGKEQHDYKYAGSNEIEDVCWYVENSENRKYSMYDGFGTQEVGEKKPNELGLYDMSGNVFEWCYDWGNGHYKYTYKNPVEIENIRNIGNNHRILRGGSWRHDEQHARVSARFGYYPDDGDYGIGIGFRIVRKKQEILE